MWFFTFFEFFWNIFCSFISWYFCSQSFSPNSEDQQALEDEGIVLSIKPSIPLPAQNRPQIHGQLPNVASITNFSTANPMLSFANNQTMIPYTQNYFGNQSIATPGFIANNFPTSSTAIPLDPGSRRKSIIENINPFISEQKGLSSDLLSAFPVSNTTSNL